MHSGELLVSSSWSDESTSEATHSAVNTPSCWWGYMPGKSTATNPTVALWLNIKETLWF